MTQIRKFVCQVTLISRINIVCNLDARRLSVYILFILKSRRSTDSINLAAVLQRGSTLPSVLQRHINYTFALKRSRRDEAGADIPVTCQNRSELRRQRCDPDSRSCFGSKIRLNLPWFALIDDHRPLINVTS